jgi:TonB family protein
MVARTVRVAAALVAPGIVWCSIGAFAQDGSVKIIVNPSNPTTSLSKARVSELFLRKATTWDDGQTVLPVEQIDSSPLRETFCREVLGMSPSAAAQQAAAAHRGDPPVSVATDREVLAYVRLKPGAIGYVSASTPIQGVRALTISKSGEATASGSRDAIRVGTNGPIPLPARVHNVPPEYPASARSQRIEGIIELDILIGTNGTVEELRILKGIPQLNDAATTAVRQWRYSPTVINGVAVPVRLIVKVSFVLNS